MKPKKPSLTLKSFKELRQVFEKRSPLPAQDLQREVFSDLPPEILKREDEEALFEAAMADVAPIDRDRLVEREISPAVLRPAKDECGDEALRELNRLLRQGEGFVVANTPEYVEGVGYQVDRRLARRLHEGEFAIEAFIDLHGCSVESAQDAFDKFLSDAIKRGKRAVLIVHGRGLSSPHEPVLKGKVVEWLTCGPWRKWVLAFSSAQRYDGGVGATYVLLRRQPATKRLRKRK